MFWFREDRQSQTEELEFLYPLGWYKKTPEERTIKFLPFYTAKKTAGEDDKRDSVDLFPFFWGKSKTRRLVRRDVSPGGSLQGPLRAG